MKHFSGWLFLPICILLAMGAQAQYVYRPLVKEGKVWNMHGSMPLPELQLYGAHPFQYLLQGDTLIDTKTFKKLHLIDNFCFHDDSLRYIGAVIEEGHKVYMVYPDKVKPVQLYDFDLEPGTVHEFDNNFRVQIKHRYCFLINSTVRYAQSAMYTYPPETEAVPCHPWYLEGVGSVRDMDPFRYDGSFTMRNTVISCYEDGVCLYYENEIDQSVMVDPAYHPLLRQGRTWTRSAEAGKTDGNGNVIVRGDTVMDYQPEYGLKKVYQKVFRKSPGLYGDERYHYFGAMREEGKKVWLVQAGKSCEQGQLMFDFGLNVNEETETAEGKARVISVDSVISAGRRYCQLTLRTNDTGRLVHWTEGIGGDAGILRSFLGNGQEESPLYVFDGDECIYIYSDVNPVTDGIQASSLPAHTAGALFGLQGRRLMHRPSRGMYIRDGKKVVVK
jgi:hypothetical protein